MYIRVDESVTSFFASLALGLLQSIRNDAVPAKVGIWSLGHPAVWEKLQDTVPARLINVLKQCDELTTMKKLFTPEVFDVEISLMIGELEGLLRSLDDPQWTIALSPKDCFSSPPPTPRDEIVTDDSGS